MELYGSLLLLVCWIAPISQVPEKLPTEKNSDASDVVIGPNLKGAEALAIEIGIRGGVHPKVDNELQAAAKRSIAWAYGWDVNDLHSFFPLSNEERLAVSQAFKQRRTANADALQRARQRINQNEKLTSEKFKEIKLKYSEDESQAEAKLLNVLDEIFPPSKLEELLITTVARKEHEFGEIEVIHRKLKLEDYQVKLFAELPGFFLSQVFEQRKKTGTIKYDPALAAVAKARLDEARNALTAEQFEFYAKAVGLIPKNVALDTFVKTCSEEKRKELSKYKVCAKILEEQ